MSASSIHNTIHPERIPVLALGMVALVAGLWAGLVRLGWTLPGTGDIALLHGPLMVSGFLGTVIGIERAVALNRLWAFAAPILTGLGAFGLVAGIPQWPAPLLMSLSGTVLVLIFVQVLRAHWAVHNLVMTGGALAWLAGNAFWLAGLPFHEVVYWWLGFLVLTIVGERLELNRLLLPARGARVAFLAALGVFVLGLALAAAFPVLGARILGAGEFVLMLWLLRFDIARRTIRQSGLVRFIAVCLFTGYIWLGIGGVLALSYGHTAAGPVYDAVLHAVFVGFVFSMIFGHAPIIFPSILGVRIEYNPRFYLHVALLHASLLTRLAGDLGGWMVPREWGGLLNVLAVLLFLANTALSIRLRGIATHSPSAGPTRPAST